MVEQNQVLTESPEVNDKNENINGWRAFASLEQFLIDDQWHPQQLEDKSIFRVYYSGDNGDLRCYAQIRVDLEQFIFYVVAPVKAPEENRSEVAEYITRANYGLRIGNFEMDYEDGEIRCKSSVDFENTVLDDKLIKNVIYAAVHTMDFYLPGLLSVMYGNENPEQAISAIEGD
ncbi:MAG: YbjN domain-containing protein [Anaerolineae bacterium]|nr:YbjN domain-containing protein [Anaerolineae bacterium]